MSELNSGPFFEQSLLLALKLESDGKEVKLNAGHIESFSLHLHPFGYTANLQFRTFDDDDVDQMFNAPKIIKAILGFLPTDPLKGTSPLLELKGIVTSKCFKRLPPSPSEEEQAQRLYEISFSDNAKATWEQHHPTNIYVDESMEDILKKHLNPEISMKFDWDHLQVKHPTTAFSLDYKEWLSPHQQTNFYSFLIWYLHQENGILTYDYKAHSYKIAGKKEKASGPPLEVMEWHVTPPICHFPQPPRYNTKVVKHTADTVENEEKENKDSFKSVRRESIDHQNYRVYPEQARQKTQSTLTSEKNEVDVEFITLVKDLQLDKITPGSFISFKGGVLKGTWSTDACFKDKKFRIRNLLFEAHKLTLTEEVFKHDQPFQIYAKAKLEEEEEPYFQWPVFVPPTYPFYIQGKIFCDIGDKEQSTFKILESKEAPQGQYLVLVPLEGQQKKVVAPFVPAYSGQYYYPFIKDTRVMLSLHFRTARIERPIDWDALVRLPGGVQGNQMVLASNGKDKYTFFRHEYVDGKDSVFTIKQSSSETQTQTIQIKEKDILVTVEEKDKKTLFLQLNHEAGCLLSLEDKNTNSHQQVVFDGKAMTHTCKGDPGTSTIVQKPDSITIECKEFTLNSDKVTIDAKDNITLKGKNKFDVASKVINLAAPKVNNG